MENISKLKPPSKRKAAAIQNDASAAKSIKKALDNLNHSMSKFERRTSIPFEEFLNKLAADPPAVIRNVFQIFHDMIKAYVGEGIEEYPDDPESDRKSVV